LDTYLQHLAVFKERRKEMLHKKWVENVVQPLQQRITDKITSYRRPGKNQVKYEHCLKQTNKPVCLSFPLLNYDLLGLPLLLFFSTVLLCA
jgi:hypothetical protein